jgi:ATP-binding cassette subfamily B protein
VTRLTNDVTQIQNFVNMLLRMALRSPGMLIAALIMAISIKPPLAVVFAVTIPLMLLTIFGIILIGFPRFNRLQTKVDALNSTVQENITNVRVVKSFVRQEHEIGKFKRANRNLMEAGLSAMNVVIFMEPVMTFFMYATTLVVIWLGSGFVLEDSVMGLSVGDFSSFIMYVNQILFSLMMVTMLLMISARALASARRIREVLDELGLSDLEFDAYEERYNWID